MKQIFFYLDLCRSAVCIFNICIMISFDQISPCNNSHFSVETQICFPYISIYRELACMYNSRREAQSSHGLMFIDFSLSVYKRPPVNRTSPWPVHSVTFPSFEQEPWTQFSAARGHTDHCDISTQHSSLGFPSTNVTVAPIPALMSCRHEKDLHLSLPASLSFYSFIPRRSFGISI